MGNNPVSGIDETGGWGEMNNSSTSNSNHEEYGRNGGGASDTYFARRSDEERGEDLNKPFVSATYGEDPDFVAREGNKETYQDALHNYWNKINDLEQQGITYNEDFGEYGVTTTDTYYDEVGSYDSYTSFAHYKGEQPKLPIREDLSFSNDANTPEAVPCPLCDILKKVGDAFYGDGRHQTWISNPKTFSLPVYNEQSVFSKVSPRNEGNTSVPNPLTYTTRNPYKIDVDAYPGQVFTVIITDANGNEKTWHVGPGSEPGTSFIKRGKKGEHIEVILPSTMQKRWTVDVKEWHWTKNTFNYRGLPKRSALQLIPCRLPSSSIS